MATKNHGGQFRCYDAALPDEPMFVILARDPAAPATVEFWATERVRQGKVHEQDDQDRIKAAIDEAKEFQEWRDRMLANAEETQQPPVWKLGVTHREDDAPITDRGGEGVRLSKEWIRQLIAKLRNAPDLNQPREVATLLELAVGGVPKEPCPHGYAYKGTCPRCGGQIDNDPPVRSIPTYEKADPTAPGGRTIHAAFDALAAPYNLPESDIAIDPTFRQKIAIGLRQVAGDMSEKLPEIPPVWRKIMGEFIDRINGYSAELEASKVDPYETFAAHVRRQQDKPLSYLWSPGDDEDEIRVTPLSFSRMAELLDYATCYGEFDENTPSGTESKYGPEMSSPMNDIRRNAIWVYKRCMGIIPEGTAPPENQDEIISKHEIATLTIGHVMVNGKSVSVEEIERVFREREQNKCELTPGEKRMLAIIAENKDKFKEALGEPECPHEKVSHGALGDGTEMSLCLDCGRPIELDGKPLDETAAAFRGAYEKKKARRATVDSAPTDLAHAPEVPPHRFSQFFKGERYAYARGLEVNPVHLPVALDAMAKDGWALLAIFGETNSQHIGFIFERAVPSIYDIKYGMIDRGHIPAMDELIAMYQRGESFVDIARKATDKDADGRGLAI